MQRKITIVLMWLCLSLLAVADTQKIPSIDAIYVDQRGYPVVEITNPSKQVFCYSGYSARAALYGIEALENGKWTDFSPGWCGNGLDLFELQPSGKITMVVSGLEGDKVSKRTLRLVFRFVRSRRDEWNEKSEVHVVYSSEIRLPLKPKG